MMCRVGSEGCYLFRLSLSPLSYRHYQIHTKRQAWQAKCERRAIVWKVQYSNPNSQYHPVTCSGCTVIFKTSQVFIFASDYPQWPKSRAVASRRANLLQEAMRCDKKPVRAQRDRTNNIIVFFCSIIGRERKMNSAETSCEGKKRNKRRGKWIALKAHHGTGTCLVHWGPCSGSAVRFIQCERAKQAQGGAWPQGNDSIVCCTACDRELIN